jgi:hypothetical protein
MDTKRSTGARPAFPPGTVDSHRNLMSEYAAADLPLRNPEKANRRYAALRWLW